MRVRLEVQGALEILRYSGTHACSDKDHEQDLGISKHLADRVRLGRDRYLLDVRKLHVVYGSGIGDLYNSWRPAHGSHARVAILWEPSRRKAFDRWAFLAVQLASVLRFFRDEGEAMAFLRPD